jgi:P pilus assembly chaperone PapD
MVDPFASRSFDLQEPVTAPGGAVALEYWFINDYGGSVNGTASASSAP